jgi:restriction system protein
MAVPDFQALMLPVLKAAANGEVRFSDLVETLADEFHLTDEERRRLLPSGKQTALANRTGWAKTYLAKAGLIRAPRRGYFEATDRGRETLAHAPARIDIKFLSQFPEFEEFRKASREDVDSSDDTAGEIVERSSRTPDEILRATHQEIEKTLRAELLDRLLQTPPAFFENTIVTLLVAMGYGGSREDAGRALGKSGDNGLDGVIDQDALGLDRVYLQAKRYKFDNAVGESEVRGFAGSLEGVKATKGVFVTTSYFTSQARAFAERIARRIVLIDGQQLAQLMIKHDVGVRIEETLHIKKIDEDFFILE